ncbi:hypothetical protein ACJW30_07G100700 [Castanea mollissima]
MATPKTRKKGKSFLFFFLFLFQLHLSVLGLIQTKYYPEKQLYRNHLSFIHQKDIKKEINGLPPPYLYPKNKRKNLEIKKFPTPSNFGTIDGKQLRSE